jgi:HlyD family secretion protein
MRRQIGVWLAVSAISIFAVYAAYRYWAGPKIVLVPVSQGDLVQTIVASGHVQNPNRIDISSQITSTVVSVTVKEGDAVRQGQLLVTLNGQEANAALLSARASVAIAREHLRQLTDVNAKVAAHAHEQSQTNFNNAQDTLDRSNALHERGFIGQAARDDAERLMRNARAQSMITQAQSASLQSQGSEINGAQANLQLALSNLEAAKAKWAYVRIHAPRSGVLIFRNVEAGDLVLPGKQLFVLSPTGVPELVVQIDEKNMKWVRVGQSAIASADAYPDQKFNARVVFINPAVDALRGSVEIKLSVIDPPEFLTQDMTVTVDVEVAKRMAVMNIPMSAVHTTAPGQAWVLRYRQGHLQKADVGLGLQGKGRVEILSGLLSSDLLAPDSQSQLHDGSAVQLANP